MTFLRSFQLVVFIFGSSIIAAAVSYDAVEVAKLPKALSLQSTYYDTQSDTVYLFAGVGEEGSPLSSNYEVYAFFLANNSVNKIADIPRDDGRFTKTHIIRSPKSDSSNLLLYLIIPQTNKETSRVYSFNSTRGTVELFGHLWFSLEFSDFVQAPTGEVYFCGGVYLDDNIFKLELESELIQWNLVGELQQDYSSFDVVLTMTSVRFWNILFS